MGLTHVLSSPFPSSHDLLYESPLNSHYYELPASCDLKKRLTSSTCLFTPTQTSDRKWQVPCDTARKLTCQ